MKEETSEKTLTLKLAEIQKKLKAPKSQYNKFAGFYYRNCEDIMEAVKPLLGDLTLTVSDEIVQVGERYYIKATAQLFDGFGGITTIAYAREPLNKKGMDESQITGATSSYARKYALNGLFAIDDTKDADSQNNTKPLPVKEEEIEEVIEAGLEDFKPTKCPMHPKQEMKQIYNAEGDQVTGHIWKKPDGTFLICSGKGFSSFEPR